MNMLIFQNISSNWPVRCPWRVDQRWWEKVHLQHSVKWDWQYMRGPQKSPPLDQALRPYHGQHLTVNLQELNTDPRKNQQPEVEGWRYGRGEAHSNLILHAGYFLACSSSRIMNWQQNPDATPHLTPRLDMPVSTQQISVISTDRQHEILGV